MANFKRDTLSAGNARSNRMPSNMPAPNGEYPRPRQPMAPSAPPVQVSHPAWAANPFPGRAYHQLPTPNANFAQSASSPSHVQGARRPNTNRHTYALPPPIDLWDCCHCGHTNLTAHCPVLCGDCQHQKCSQCGPTPDQHMPSTVRKRGFELDESLSRHHSWSEAVTKMLAVCIRGVFRTGFFSPRSDQRVSTAGDLALEAHLEARMDRNVACQISVEGMLRTFRSFYSFFFYKSHRFLHALEILFDHRCSFFPFYGSVYF